MTDQMERLYMQTLKQTGYPVSQPPAGGAHETYITFQEVSALLTQSASNMPQRIRYLVQVHAYSRLGDGTHRLAMIDAVKKLLRAGVRVAAWGPDDYEQGTGIYHTACTTEWWDSVD